jgi:hypothetical protein
MAFDLASITAEARLRAPRIILLGVEKIGKSTFASCSDAPVVIPVKGEEGVDTISVPKFPPCGSYGDVMEALSSLYSQKHEFGTVVIDSASACEPLIWAETCRLNGNAQSIEKVNGGYGKGYVEALSQWRMLTEGLDALRTAREMASIIIGHVRVKRHDEPGGDSYDQYQFDLNDKAANLLYRWADVILFCNTKVVVKKEDVGFNKKRGIGIDTDGGQRFVYTQKRPAHPGGGRGVYGRLPYELPLSWQAFSDAVAAAS